MVECGRAKVTTGLPRQSSPSASLRSTAFILRLGLGLRGIFGQDCLESRTERRRMAFGKNERRAKLDHVVMRAVRACENCSVAQPIYDVRGVKRRWFSRFARKHQIQTQK